MSNEITDREISIVAEKWQYQYENDEEIDLSPETCDGMSEDKMQKCIDFLYANN